jgi:hypothetical protein
VRAADGEHEEKGAEARAGMKVKVVASKSTKGEIKNHTNEPTKLLKIKESCFGIQPSC